MAKLRPAGESIKKQASMLDKNDPRVRAAAVSNEATARHGFLARLVRAFDYKSRA